MNKLIALAILAAGMFVAYSAPQVLNSAEPAEREDTLTLEMGDSTFQANMVAAAPTRRVTLLPEGENADTHISGLVVDQSAHALESVRVTVTNATSSEQRTLTVGYTLDAVWTPDPSSNPIYASPERTIHLEAGQSSEEQLDYPSDLAPGMYRLSTWSQLADGERTAGLIYDFRLTPPFTFALPIADAAESFTVSVSQLTTPQASSTSVAAPFAASFTIKNNTSAVRLVSMFYSVVPPYSLLTEDPWSVSVFDAPPRFASIKPGEAHVFTDDRIIAAPQGTYRIIVWIHELVDGELVFRAAYSENMSITINP